jgi:hypothetical protein
MGFSPTAEKLAGGAEIGQEFTRASGALISDPSGLTAREDLLFPAVGFSRA